MSGAEYCFLFLTSASQAKWAVRKYLILPDQPNRAVQTRMLRGVGETPCERCPYPDMRALTRLENKQNYGAIYTTYFYVPPYLLYKLFLFFIRTCS
jgi:hypothetical protein